MRVLVTGGAGFIGSHTVLHLLADRPSRVEHGGLLRIVPSVIGEIVFSTLLAPIMAIAHTRDNPEETPVAVGFDKTRFLAPVFLGDTVTVTYEFTDIDLKRRRTSAHVEVRNQHEDLVAVTRHLLQWVPNEQTDA